MKAARIRWLAGAMLVGSGFAACTGAISGGSTGPSGAGGSGTSSSTGSGNTGGSGNGAGNGNTSGTGNSTGNGGTGGMAVVYPPGGPAPTVLPIRRLTNSEYTQSVNDLFPGFTIPPPTFILDNKVFGFVNLSSSQSASQVLMEQYEGAAEMIALGDDQSPQVWTGVAANPDVLTACNSTAMGQTACAQPYLYGLAKRAYRRPLTTTEQAALLALFTNPAGGTYSQRLGLAIEGILISPNFIFRPELGDATKVVATGILSLTPWEMATRLSYFINGSMPDAALTASADSGALANAAEVRAQATRLLALPRSQQTLVTMHQEWLGVDGINALTKPAAFPTFTSTLAYEMGQETATFVKNVMFTQGGTFNDLLLSPYTFGNADIASFYGSAVAASSAPPSADLTVFNRIDLNPAQRTGLLTQPSLMATLAKDSASQDLGTAIIRGKFVLQQILCRAIQEPSQALVATFSPLDLTVTTRAQAATHETSPVCAGCHSIIDPLGLPFENYDMIGQWRDTDKGMPIDASGQIGDAVTNANPVAYKGIPALAALVAQRTETRACYLQQWFQFSTGKLVAPPDQPFLDWMTQNFTPTQKLVDLVVNMVASDSFRQLAPAN